MMKLERERMNFYEKIVLAALHVLLIYVYGTGGGTGRYSGIP